MTDPAETIVAIRYIHIVMLLCSSHNETLGGQLDLGDICAGNASLRDCQAEAGSFQMELANFHRMGEVPTNRSNDPETDCDIQ